MRKCVRCGKRGIFLKLSNKDLCASCEKAAIEEYRIADNLRIAEIEKQKQLKAEQEKREQEARDKIIELAIQHKQEEYKKLVSNIKICHLHISDDPSKIILIKDFPEISYSNITKKTPRDKLGNFVVLDTETTGLRPSSCEIIDIAAIRFRNFLPTEKASMLLKPKKPIPPAATNINGISDDMVEGQPFFQQIAAALVEFIGDDNIVGHNLPFDLSFILRYGADITMTKRKYYDTLEISRKTIKKARMKWDKEYQEYLYDSESEGIENYQLDTLCRWYGVPHSDAHRAESDALATGFLLNKLAEDRL